MKTTLLLLAVLLLAGCLPDAPDVSSPGAAMQSTSSRRSRDPDAPRQMCNDTSIGGESRTVCY